MSRAGISLGNELQQTEANPHPPLSVPELLFVIFLSVSVVLREPLCADSARQSCGEACAFPADVTETP